MKKFLLLFAVAIAALSVSAQKHTINVRTLAPKAASKMLVKNEVALANTNAPKSTMNKVEESDENYVEVAYEYSDGEYEEEQEIATTAAVSITSLGSGEYKGKMMERLEIAGIGAGYCTCDAYRDEDGTIYIPRQVAYIDEKYGEMYFQALEVNENNQATLGEGDVILSRFEDGTYICLASLDEESIKPGDCVGWWICMTDAAHPNGLWTYGIETEYLVPNGTEHGWYNINQSGYLEHTYPVYIDVEEEDVLVIGAFGMASLYMSFDAETSEVYIPTGQPIAAMPAQSGYETDGYGEYFRTYSYVVVPGTTSLRCDLEADYTPATLSEDGKTIDCGEEGYISLQSIPDSDGAAYRIGMVASPSWTLNEGTFVDATGLNSVKANIKNSNAMYNLAGQQVSKDYKGLVIRNGQKFMNK